MSNSTLVDSKQRVPSKRRSDPSQKSSHIQDNLQELSKAAELILEQKRNVIDYFSGDQLQDILKVRNFFQVGLQDTRWRQILLILEKFNFQHAIKIDVWCFVGSIDIKRFLSSPDVKESDKKFETNGRPNGFQKMVEVLHQEFEYLKESELLVAIFGKVKVGKSTLGNRLLGEKIFSTGARPTTSFVTIVHSAPKIQNSKASFVPFIETEDDIESILRLAEINDGELNLRLRTLWRNGGNINDFDDHYLLAATHASLREYPIISCLDMHKPIWNISQRGLAIADCPGTKELSPLSSLAQTIATKSSVLIFVTNVETTFTKNDNDILDVVSHLQAGGQVLFALNIRSFDLQSDIDQTIASLIQTFEKFFPDFTKEHTIHAFDFLQNDKGLVELQMRIADILRKRSQQALYSFLNGIFDVIRSQHLFVSRLLSVTMERQASISSSFRKSQDVQKDPSNKALRKRHEKDIKDMTQNMKKLEAAAKTMMTGVEEEFDQLFQSVIANFEADMKMNDKWKTIPVPINFEMPPSAPLFSVSAPKETSFEAQFRRQLQIEFQILLETKIISFLRKKQQFLTESMRNQVLLLEGDLEKVLSEQERLIWSPSSRNLFRSLRQGISTLRPEKVTQLTMMTAGIVGTAGLGAGLAAGIAGAVVLTGGIVVLAGLAVASGIWGIVNIAQEKKASDSNNEENTRSRIFTTLIENIRKALSSKAKPYLDFKQSQLCILYNLIESFMVHLSSHLIEVESIVYLDKQKLTESYPVLCNYLRLRDELTECIDTLTDEIEIVDQLNRMELLSDTERNQRLNARWQEKAQLSKHEFCYVCSKKRNSCGHLCRDCDFTLGSEQCPYCNLQPRWIAERLKLKPDVKVELSSIISAKSLKLVPSNQPSSLRSSTSSDIPLNDIISEGEARPIPKLSSRSTSTNMFTPLLEDDELLISQNISSTALSTNPSSSSVAILPLSHLLNSPTASSPSVSTPPIDQTVTPILTATTPMKKKPAPLVMDEMRLRVQLALDSFSSEIGSFADWFEGKFLRFVNDSSYNGEEVELLMIEAINYLITQLLTVLPRDETGISYELKLKIIEESHSRLFAMIGPTLWSISKRKHRSQDASFLAACTLAQERQLWSKSSDTWNPGLADMNLLQQAVDAISSLDQVPSPFAKYSKLSNAWQLLHLAHQDQLIGADVMWEAFAWALTQSSYKNMVTDTSIIFGTLTNFVESSDTYKLNCFYNFPPQMKRLVAFQSH